MPELRLSEAVAASSSRRGFLARAGRLLLGVAGGGVLAGALRAQKAEAYHFCGHIYTTGSCPHPVGLMGSTATDFPCAPWTASRWTTSAGPWMRSGAR